MKVENETPKPQVVKHKSKFKTTNKIGKCSHLYLQEKFLRKIPKLTPSKDLQVLYLYNNDIEKIENLEVFPNLTSLYLHHNRIEKIENLKALYSLRKLYIGHNKISVLEELESLVNLEELHIEKQCLSDNNSLCLDPRTIHALQETLTVLNISHNNLISMSYLSPLNNLVFINASFNDLDDIKDVCQTIRNWYRLREAVFTGNPITKRHRYREDVIANTNMLGTLDNKPVTEVTRKFIKRFETEKLIHGSKQSINIAEYIPDLPKNYPLALQKAASAALLKKSEGSLSQDTVFDESEAVFIAWKTMPQRKPLRKTSNIKREATTEKKRVVINSFPQIANF